MAKPTTHKSNSKNKNVPLLKDEDAIEPVWAEDGDMTVGPPKQFSESLKRIGEQAKDWEEIPRPRKEKPAAATAAEGTSTTPAPQVTTFARPGTVSVPKWAAGLVVALLVVSSALLVWLGLQAMTLNKTVAEQNRAVAELSTEMKQMTEALGSWRNEVEAAADAAAKAAEAHK